MAHPNDTSLGQEGLLLKNLALGPGGRMLIDQEKLAASLRDIAKLSLWRGMGSSDHALTCLKVNCRDCHKGEDGKGINFLMYRNTFKAGGKKEGTILTTKTIGPTVKTFFQIRKLQHQTSSGGTSMAADEKDPVDNFSSSIPMFLDRGS